MTGRVELRAGRCRISGGFLLGAALILWIEPAGGVLTAWGIGAVLHELGHILAARGLGLPVRGLHLTLFGAVLDIGLPSSNGEEVLLALGGPVVNLLTALLWPERMLGEMSLLLAVFNLLPVLPLDGGRMVAAVADAVLPPEWGERVTEHLGWAVCGGVLGLAAAGRNPVLLMMGLWLTAAGLGK